MVGNNWSVIIYDSSYENTTHVRNYDGNIGREMNRNRSFASECSTPRKCFIGICKEESSNKILTYNKINNIHMICTSLGNNVNNTNNNRLYYKNWWKILRKKENSLKHLWVKYFSDGNIFLLVNFALSQIISNDVHESHRRRKECNIGVDF